MMIRNYFKIAWRNLKKDSLYSIQNIFGLSIALSVSLFAIMYIVDEWSYDRFHENADRIYRVNTDIKINDYEQSTAKSSDVIGPLLIESYPQIETFVRFFEINRSLMIKIGNDFFEESNVAYADASFFEVFSIDLIAAKDQNLLQEPNTVIITQSVAKKYFGKGEAVGQTLEVDENSFDIHKKNTYTVAAVIADFADNSHFGFDLIFPMINLSYGWGNYAGNNLQTYVLLNEGVDYNALNQQLGNLVKMRIYPSFIQQLDLGTESWEAFNQAGNQLKYSLFPMTDIHLISNRSGELKPNGNLQLTYISSLLVFFVLLIACINFANLSTARAVGRVREIGLRKVMGSDRRSLVIQFIGEAFALVAVAMILAILITAALLPYFNGIMLKAFDLSYFFSGKLVSVLFILFLTAGLLAGGYPAFYLSGFKTAHALKGKTETGIKKGLFRNSLVVFQFSISIILIVGTIVIYSQLDHIQKQDIGYEKEQVLAINNINYLGENAPAFKHEVLKVPGIISGSLASSLPVNSSELLGYFSHDITRQKHQSFQGRNWFVDDGYIKTMGMTLVDGRGFSREHGSEHQSVLINEEAVKLLDIQNPVGKKIYTEISEFTIIGIVKNFNYESLRKEVGPVILNFNEESEELAAFRIAEGVDMAEVVAQVRSIWQTLTPHSPFTFFFIDDAFDNTYRNEQLMGKIVITVSVLAILIACVGLFGLVAYTTGQRIKEIGIRKVLGASEAGIVQMLSSDFIKLVLIANLIASPIAWWAMNRWLEDFAYRIDIEWWMFAIAGLLAVVIAQLTVSFQAIRAAVANPVESLRSE